MKNYNKKQIQQHIQNARNGKRYKRRFCVPHAAKNGGLKIIKQNNRHSEKIYAKIKKSQIKDIGGNVQRRQKRRGCKFANQRNGKSAYNGNYY